VWFVWFVVQIMIHGLTPELAERFARIALGHVEREYPNKLDHVLEGPQDARGPRALHPVFYGSFDWHSCVHGYWTLARVLRLYPQIPASGAIAALFERQLTAGKAAAELAYLERPSARGFERPYGWGWLLKLHAELEEPWAGVLAPLAEAFADRFKAFLPKLTYAVRSGTHNSTAFALRLAADHPDPALQEMIRGRSLHWFGADADCQAWEPSGEDFLSPALIEAELMRRILPSADFLAWFGAFLPRLEAGSPRTLFEPALSSDRSDGKLAHLDGVNLSRAWCWRSLAGALPGPDPRRGRMLAAADRHLEASLPAVEGDYMGEHWLASFALLALTEAG
jgi:hypothetical protein